MPGLYSISVSGLKEGSHLYDFKINSDFFSSFENALIMESDLDASVELIKRSGHMELIVSIDGSVKLVCDRCLELYDQPVNTEDRMLVKFGEEWDEIDDEVMVIPQGENELDLTQLLYEYSHLGLPLKKVHPDDSEGNSTCNNDMLEKLDQHSVSVNSSTDPRWSDLEKLKNNN